MSFFAPHAAYASGHDPTAAVDEFRDLVKALHRAGIEVILDVVYNHTAEVGADGPTFSFRGLANDDYYLLDAAGGFVDDSGTGNTFNANRPIVRRLIIDSLRYWVQEMHVDGFRFDLAAVLSRDEAGQPMVDPPALWDIETDPVLAGTKLIAEAWDAGGLYQVGSFVGERWVEWNGRFRDDVRSFVKGDRDTVPAIMQRFLGSPDIYGHKRREPQASVNFVTCHDGFTLNDLVSYDAKHNEANGEGNRDGNDQNLSWNCGVEGPTNDPAIEASARPPGPQLPGDRPARAGRPDAAHGRRGAPDAVRQQQRLLPRRSAELVRLDRGRAAGRPAALHARPHPAAPPGDRRAGPARRHQPARPSGPGIDRMGRGRPWASRTSAPTRTAWR